MTNARSLTLSEIVKKNYKAAEVFEKFNLDFCCGGSQTLGDACLKNNIDANRLIDALDAIGTDIDHNMNFDMWPLDMLASYIQKRHHKYLEEKLPVIKNNLEKLSSIHGQQHPELFEIKELFTEMAGEITVHLKKEEFMIFPYIKKMVNAKQVNSPFRSPLIGTLTSSVDKLTSDHAAEGANLKKLSELTNHYETPSDGCSTYHITYHYLKDFEQDMHRHIHLENNILFPKATILEAELLSSRD